MREPWGADSLQFLTAIYNSTHIIMYKYNEIEFSDFRKALPGQWFIGVISTSPVAIFISPVNIFERRGELDVIL